MLPRACVIVRPSEEMSALILKEKVASLISSGMSSTDRIPGQVHPLACSTVPFMRGVKARLQLSPSPGRHVYSCQLCPHLQPSHNCSEPATGCIHHWRRSMDGVEGRGAAGATWSSRLHVSAAVSFSMAFRCPVPSCPMPKWSRKTQSRLGLWQYPRH